MVSRRMATASTARPQPATRSGGALHRLAPAALCAVAVAAVMRLVYGPWTLNYDARYALLWARDLAHGHAPEYGADFAPTPHPLQTALGLLALPFGDASDDVLILITLLAFGALVYLAYALGAQLFTRWVGVVAAVVVLTRPAIERDALLAYQDVPFAALIVGAVLVEARRPRAGLPVLVMLAVAGLLRPEAWVLSGLYVIWIWHHTGRKAPAIALAAAAPVIWAVTDWIVTGDPLHSLHGTADLAIANDRRRSVTDVPYWTAQYFGYALREPVVVGIPVGLAFAWLHARKAATLPVAVVVAMVAVFAIGPIFGLPLIRRYIEAPAVLLSLFYGLAVAGFAMLPRGTARSRWMAGGIVVGLLSVAFIPWHARMLDTVANRIDSDGALYGDLQTAMRSPQVKAAFAACPDMTAGDHRPIPFARFWLGGAPGTVSTVEGRASPMGKLLLMPVKGPTTRRIYPPKVFPKVATPAGFRTIYANRSWRVSAAPGCA
jgi:hypothetical protein